MSHSFSSNVVSNTFSVPDLYYLAFPKDRQFVKCLVYGTYIVEFVQTILVAHDAFAAFGYGFGDLEALAGIHFNWLSVPIMVAIGVYCIFYSYSATHREPSCFSWAELLCVPNLHIVKVTNRPSIGHLCSLPFS